MGNGSGKRQQQGITLRKKMEKDLILKYDKTNMIKFLQHFII